MIIFGSMIYPLTTIKSSSSDFEYNIVLVNNFTFCEFLPHLDVPHKYYKVLLKIYVFM